MSSRTLKLLCLGLFLWSVASTALLIRQQNPQTPRLEKEVSLELATQTSRSVHSLENVGFLRQFLEQFFTYNSSNFWQTQTALAFSMEPTLRQNRLSEIERLRPKLSTKDYAQRARLLKMDTQGENRFEATLEIQMFDGGKENTLFMQVRLELKEVPRAVENPWGREVQSMTLETEATNPLSTQSKLIPLSAETPLLLAFHCAVENIRLNKGSPIIAKMTTMNVSEIQVLVKTALQAPALVGANCKEQSYELELISATKSTTIFLDVGPHFAKAKPLNLGRKKKDPYQRTLEDQLDFIMED